MNSIEKNKYDEFYVAYLDKRGNIIFPRDKNEINAIKKILSIEHTGSIIYLSDVNEYYKFRIKRKNLDGQMIQVIELSNVTEFYKKVIQASIDETTHLNNKSCATNLFLKYIESAYRKNQSLTISLLDIDDFKKTNDTYGHINGDLVLSEISSILLSSTRHDQVENGDIVARVGGDEFMIVMKNISQIDAQKRIEQIRKKVAEQKIHIFSEIDRVRYINIGTLSIGMYHVSAEEINSLYEKKYTTEEVKNTLYNRTDEALYESKNNGKNQITIYSKEKIKKLIK